MIAAHACDQVKQAETVVEAIMNVLRLSPLEIQNIAKLCLVQWRWEGGMGRRSVLRSVELASDSPGRRSEPEMEALAMARLMRVIVRTPWFFAYTELEQTDKAVRAPRTCMRSLHHI